MPSVTAITIDAVFIGTSLLFLASVRTRAQAIDIITPLPQRHQRPAGNLNRPHDSVDQSVIQTRCELAHSAAALFDLWSRPRPKSDDQEVAMNVFADSLRFDLVHTVLTLTFVPVLAGVAAAALAAVRNSGSATDLGLSSGFHGAGRVWDIRHGWRHRRPSWMSDRRAKWAGRPERLVKPLRPATVDPR